MLSNKGVCVGGKSVHIPTRLEVGRLGRGDEPPLLLPHDLPEHVNTKSAVDIGPHVRDAHENLCGCAFSGFDVSNSLRVNHAVEFCVVVEDVGSTRDVERFAGF